MTIDEWAQAGIRNRAVFSPVRRDACKAFHTSRRGQTNTLFSFSYGKNVETVFAEPSTIWLPRVNSLRFGYITMPQLTI